MVSASDQSELRNILPLHFANIGIPPIYDGPTSKVENIGLIPNRHDSKSTVFYGASVQDVKAALHHNIRFIGLTKYAVDATALVRFCEEMDLSFSEGLEQV